MSWDAYQAAYKAANQNTKNLVDSNSIPNCVEKVVVGQNLNPAHQRILVQQTTFHFLGITTAEQAEMELKKASVADAERILSTVITCVKNAQPVAEVEAQTQPTATPPPAATPTQNYDEQPTWAKKPDAAQVLPIRTMQGDMRQTRGEAPAEEKTYSSTQEAILKESAPKPRGEVPPPPPPRAV